MNRHNSHQQLEATADNANAKQWQIDVPEQGASKVGNYGNASDVNGGKNANDINHISDQGEIVEVRVIKGDRDEPNDRPGQVEQGDQDSQTVRTGAEESQYSTNVDLEERNGRAVKTSTETQSKKRGIIELLGSSPLGIVAQTALDSVRHSVHEIQVDRQIKLIDRTVSHYNGDEAQQDYNQLNQLVDEGKIKLSDGRVLKEYLERIDRASSGEVADSNTEFVNKFIQEDKIDLSKSEAREEYLKVALSFCWNSKRFGVQEAISTGKLDLNNEETADQFLEAMNEDDAFNTYGINLLEASGISSEQIKSNPHIQQLTLERFGRIVRGEICSTLDQTYPLTVPQAIDSPYFVDTLGQIVTDETKREQLTDNLDIQRYGERLIESTEFIVSTSVPKEVVGKYRNKVSELAYRETIPSMSKYIGALKRLGYRPFRTDESLDRLNHRRLGKLNYCVQQNAQKLGLLDQSTIDRLYDRRYDKLLAWAERGDASEQMPTCMILPSLRPSPENTAANYWLEQSRRLGGTDALAMSLERIHATRVLATDSRPAPDLSELIGEDGLRSGFYRKVPGLPLYNLEYDGRADGYDDRQFLDDANFVTVNRDKLDAQGRVMADVITRLNNDDGDHAQALLAYRKYVSARQPGDQAELFDQHGQPTGDFYNLVFNSSKVPPGDFIAPVDPGWRNHYTPPELAFISFTADTGFDPAKYTSPENRRELINQLFAQGEPSSALLDRMVTGDTEIVANQPQLMQRLPDYQKHFVDLSQSAGFPASLGRLSGEEVNEYFDDKGATPALWQYAFKQGDYNLIIGQNRDSLDDLGLDDKQLTTLRAYDTVSDLKNCELTGVLKNYLDHHYDEITPEALAQLPGLLTKLSRSNASEVAEHAAEFAGVLLDGDLAKAPEKLAQIEQIFLHNHLPYVGKVYLVFRTMHPSLDLETNFEYAGHFGSDSRISPVLQQATGDLKSGKLDQMLNSRDTIIISDLLRASLGSNNRSIREYLATLKNGQTLLDQLSSGELDWSTFNQPTNLMDKDTKASYDTLSTFAWHLATIYNSTLPGKEHPYQLIHQQPDQSTKDQSIPPNALQTDFTNLTSLIKPNSRYTLADRAVRYFAHFVGIEDLAGAERYMDNVVKEADARNRRTAEYLATTSDPKLQPGDLVKGMGGWSSYGISNLESIMQNGATSKEFLGDASWTDTTPLDTDLSIVLAKAIRDGTVSDTIKQVFAYTFGGGLWSVLKRENASGESSFVVTRSGQDNAKEADVVRARKEGKPEAYYIGLDHPDHYGIRTGFGMNAVSFFIADDTKIKNLFDNPSDARTDSTPVSEVTKLEIALGGFYIPIIDRDSEELIFTPADYDKMREQMSGLSYYHTGDYQFAPDSELELPSTNVKETVIPGTTTIISELSTSMAEIDRKHEVINQVVKQAITSIPDLNLSYKDYLDGDLTENIVEMIDTGSTGRQTNAPGSGDFDYIARLDRSILNDPTKKQQITDALLTAFGRENDGSAIVNGNLRLKQVSIDGLAEPVDIDITFTQKTNKVQYSTDMALADRLTNIKQQSETKYQQVLANIIHAKQFLKAAGAYKPRRSPEAEGVGGLGGVGIENWVLQHGGSFKQAARDFLSVADSCSSFEDFCAHYPVWDYGENHKGIKSKPHDNFVADNMNQEGYERMKEALRAVVN